MVLQSMILSRRKKFIFTALNKTGTSSIEKVLARYENPFTHRKLAWRYKRAFPNDKEIFKHIAPYSLRELIGRDTWDEYKTFAFVRNPWDRLVSVYHQNRKRPEKFPLAQESFETWIKGGGTGSARKSMVRFVSDENGNIMVDFIGRFENLEEDFETMCNMIGIEAVLPHLNRTKHTHYREYYTDETREIVRQRFAKDIEMFCYQF